MIVGTTVLNGLIGVLTIDGRQGTALIVIAGITGATGVTGATGAG
jgi:hypothetical protein